MVIASYHKEIFNEKKNINGKLIPRDEKKSPIEYIDEKKSPIGYIESPTCFLKNPI